MTVETNYRFAGNCSACGNTTPPLTTVHLRITSVHFCQFCVAQLVEKLVEGKALENRAVVLINNQPPDAPV